MTPGARLQNEIRERLSRTGSRLFNMTSGKFWAGHSPRVITRTQTITVQPGDVVLRNGRMVNVGFAGLSDLFGGTPMTITAEDVGKTVSVLTALEVKAGKDRPRDGQPEFIAAVQAVGGRGGFCRSVDDAIRIATPETDATKVP